MPTLRQRLAASVLRRYPLLSGRGTIANHAWFNKVAGSSDELVWAETRGGKIRCSLADFVGRAAYYGGELDPKITRLVERLVPPGAVTCDVGANIGLVTLALAKQVGATGRVFAFEPNPHVAALLEETLAASSLTNVSLARYGLGARPGTMVLSVPPINAGAASVVRRTEGASALAVEIRTLDASLRGSGADVQFIKIDVEGFEAEVLKGATQTLRRCRPLVLFEENTRDVAGPERGAVRVLHDHGYALFAIPKTFLRLKLTRYRPGVDAWPGTNDMLGVPEERAAEVARLFH